MKTLLTIVILSALAWPPVSYGAAPRPTPQQALQFFSLLVPELQSDSAAFLRSELLALLSKDETLLQKAALQMEKYYDPKSGRLNRAGAKLARKLSRRADKGAGGRSAMQILAEIPQDEGLNAKTDASGEGKAAGSARHFDGADRDVISAVSIETKNVFDPDIPGENNRLFRLANRLHITTKKNVIERELLFKPGEKFSPHQALETERNLRALPFIKRAEVVPAPSGRNKLDIKVKTQDAWTTQVDIGAEKQGDDHAVHAGVTEQNLFGRGKMLALQWEKSTSLVQKELLYMDPSLLGSRLKLISLFAETTVGTEKGIDLHRPFYSLRDARSYGVTALSETVAADLYSGGEISNSFDRTHRFYKAAWGMKIDAEETSARRVHLGYLLEDSRFRATDKTAPGSLPEDRRLSGPLAGFSWAKAQYIKETNIDRMRRVEDFNLGREGKVEVGLAPAALGSDKNRFLFQLTEQKGHAFAPGFFALAQAGTQGRVAEGKLENSLFFGNVNLVRKLDTDMPQTGVIHLEAAYGENLDGESQMRLGGNSGLRGYRINSFTGNKSVLANAEWRVFHPKEFFRLVHMGAAAFVDYGAVAPQGRSLRAGDFKADLGVGLRFSSSRSTGGHVLRVDMAYAPNAAAGRQNYVFSIVGGQAFGAFNNAIGRLLGDSASHIREEDSGKRFNQRSR
ncbi:MAG: BamA/TamA family outer membrane protein [Elusimicrobia bacterium]|nr:BamA/TamA family outer membrane protein [Elusimicrobiota bacterium]